MKLFERESYNEVLERMIEDTLELNEATKREITEAKAKIRSGAFVTQDDIERQLGL